MAVVIIERTLNLIDLLVWAKGVVDLNEGDHMHITGE
jgi:hypothetical protein